MNGNGGRMFGGGTSGIQINQGDKVILKNMPLIDDFENGVVATNEGTLQIGSGLSDTVVLNGKVTGTNGTVQIGGKVTIGDEYHNYTWAEATAGNYDVRTSLSGIDYYLSMQDLSQGTSLIDQKSIHVLQDSSLTANANLLKASDESGIIVDGTLTLTGGTTQSVITSTSEITTGVVQIGEGATVEANKEIKSSNLIINENAKLVATDTSGILSSSSITNNGTLEVLPQNLQPNNEGFNVNNNGTLDLTGGTLNAANIIGEGIVNIHGVLVKADDKSITAGSIILKNTDLTHGATLTTDADTLHGNIMIEDQATLALNKGTLTGNVSGNGLSSGTMVVSGGANEVGASGTITDVLVNINAGSTLNMEDAGLMDTNVTNLGTLTGTGANFASTAVITNKGTVELTGGVLDTEIINVSGQIMADNGTTVDAKVDGGIIVGQNNTGNNFTVTNGKDTNDRYTGNVFIYAGDGNDTTVDKENTLNISGILGNATRIYGNKTESSDRLGNTLHITDSKTEVGFIGVSDVGGTTFNKMFAFDTYVFDVDSEDAKDRGNNAMLTLHQGSHFNNRKIFYRRRL